MDAAHGSRNGLPESEINELVETIHKRSRGKSLKATGKSARNLDLYQVNCTFYDALGGRDNGYLLARALQFFAPGIPQVYYVGLLAGRNDLSLLKKTGEGRDINRHIFSEAEILKQLERPVVKAFCRLIRFRNSHAAFDGDFRILESASDSTLRLRWSAGEDWAELDADFLTRTFRISYSEGKGSGTLNFTTLMEP